MASNRAEGKAAANRPEWAAAANRPDGTAAAANQRWPAVGEELHDSDAATEPN
jgi:hypothetical protein